MMTLFSDERFLFPIKDYATTLETYHNIMMNKDTPMREYYYNIAEAISRGVKFSPLEIVQTYYNSRSWDDTILLCDYCARFNLSLDFSLIDNAHVWKNGMEL
jgi:hypothetical protein